MFLIKQKIDILAEFKKKFGYDFPIKPGKKHIKYIEKILRETIIGSHN